MKHIPDPKKAQTHQVEITVYKHISNGASSIFPDSKKMEMNKRNVEVRRIRFCAHIYTHIRFATDQMLTHSTTSL